MPEHQPTPEQLAALADAHGRTYATQAKVAQANADLAQAMADDSEARTALSEAINAVVYGPQTADQVKPRTTT
ncbi:MULTISPECIES: hypothetical protein [unclassified Streptomyces]|uniref:hypothetical protein n=1 Tax=unclassified Streptomyces TaxID=2593676 RepID=UPI001F442AF8|nr:MULTISPECIES: hypothetical protein [unclassified Streptomyces]MCF0087153.1 hypothetical protein [Streptomyces sp. MH192]MCF0099009.1 hypothetical protein [Streptomyces sp. MH191]